MRPLPTWTILLALAASSAPVAAQTPATTTAGISNEADAMNEKARELFKEGNKLYRDQKYAQAEAAYEAAWALTDKKSKGLVNNLGQTEMHLGKYREAAEHLTIARRLAAHGDKQLSDIERDLAESKTKVCTLTITTNVEGAQLLLGDKPLGRAPLVDPVFVDPGKVTVSALKDGYAAAKLEVDARAGQDVPVKLALMMADSAPLPTASATGTAALPPPPRSKVPAIVMGSVAVVGAALGTGLLIGSRDKYDATQKITEDIRANKKSCVDGATNYDARCAGVATEGRGVNVLRDAGIVSIAAAGAAAAGAAIYLLWPAPGTSTRAVRVMPVASDTAAGLVMTGKF